MSIEVQCPKCTKLIRAPDGARGKHGKCPYCENEIYIPTPPDELDEIPLAPIDKQQERHAEQLRAESIKYGAAVNKDKSVVRDTGGARSSTDGPPLPAPPAGEVLDVGDKVKRFVIAMRDSKLDRADSIAAELKRHRQQARDYIEGLLLDQMPPDIEGVPPALLKGLLNKLLKDL